jgi:methylated-DNA-protein-cysteine methyltransferase-like protein
VPATTAREFRRRVHAVVARVPRGRVITYGQVAALAGRPRAARLVGWLAHSGPAALPWQRVVNRFGGLARGYTGGRRGHREDLQRDGVTVRDDETVDLQRYQWRPTPDALRRVYSARPTPAGKTAARRAPGPR